jgi:hypothetical protein
MSPERSNAQAADPLAAERRWFAEELRAVANLESDALVDAFARVRREHYLGPGPWPIARPTGAGPTTSRPTPIRGGSSTTCWWGSTSTRG